MRAPAAVRGGAAHRPAIAAGATAEGVSLFLPAAETRFDPARINDIYSRTVTALSSTGAVQFDPLRRPFVRPNVADGMPEHSDDYRTWTVRLKPGIYFDDDPAFKGRKRELVAQDSSTRTSASSTPANKSPVYVGILEEGMLGWSAARTLAEEQPFDYDREVEGLRALDRYTVQFRLAEPRPALHLTQLAG